MRVEVDRLIGENGFESHYGKVEKEQLMIGLWAEITLIRTRQHPFLRMRGRWSLQVRLRHAKYEHVAYYWSCSNFAGKCNHTTKASPSFLRSFLPSAPSPPLGSIRRNKDASAAGGGGIFCPHQALLPERWSANLLPVRGCDSGTELSIGHAEVSTIPTGSGVTYVWGM